MTHNEAVNYLKNYTCACPYGESPNDDKCQDQSCEFYQAINSLEYKENDK